MDIDALAGVTPFAAELRYDPDFWPDRETAVEAIALAGELRSQIETLVPKR